MIDPSHFAQIDMRVGRVVAVDPFPEARNPRLLAMDPEGGVVLLAPDVDVPPGARIP